MQQTARNEFTQALKALVQERGLEVETILELLKEAYVAAYKRDARDRGEEIDDEVVLFTAEIDPANGEAKIFKATVEAPDDKTDVTPPGFGRIAAQTAKQVIHQKIREAEKTAVMGDFEGRVGGLITGMVLRFDGPNVRVDLGKTEALMPAEERVPSERLASGQRLSFLLKEIQDSPRGKNILLSRADPEFVKKIFAREVPEIASGAVEIKAIAREAGARTKIAVFSSQSGVDPVGSCVGQKGIRVQAVTNELGGERIDIIPFSENQEEFLKATFAPVNVISLTIDEKEGTAKVTVADSELSLAIGKDGQNVRLAGKLTNLKVEIEGDGSGPKVEDAAAEDVAVSEETTAAEAEKVEVKEEETPVEAQDTTEVAAAETQTEEVKDQTAESTTTE